MNCNLGAIALWQKDSFCVISLITTENPENTQSQSAFQITQALMLSHYCLIQFGVMKTHIQSNPSMSIAFRDYVTWSVHVT